MKQIELTEEHKSKLLEMCKVLFPKLDICLTGQAGRAWDSNIECFINIWNIKTNEILIHWFEFCMTYLITKINYQPEKVNNSALINVDHILNCKRHPVDYLYNEFKNLNFKKSSVR